MFMLILVVSTISIGTISYFMNRNDSIQMHGDRALGIARTVAAAVDTDAYAEILSSGQKTEYWHTFKAYLDEVITNNRLVYLYVLHDYDSENVYYFAEGMIEGDTIASLDLHDTEPVEDHDERLGEVFDGAEIVSTEIYSSEEWGHVISGMAPIVAKDGTVLGVIGADVSIEDVLESANQFGFMILLLVIGISVLMGIMITIYLRRSLGSPIAELTGVAGKLARGEIDVSIKTKSETEIGVLADSFRDMIETIRHQAQTLKSIAEGDLSVTVLPRSENDVMSLAFLETIDRLNAMISQINQLTARIAQESGKIATSAGSLAKGASSQASAVEQLSSSITEISYQTKQNTDLAEKSASLANKMQSEATSGFAQMEQLIAAVNEINEASNAVRFVLKVIEDIAFQTNILSLNASVEAARVGEQGRGFAVVSREVQNLSKKTAESAKETASLIADSIAKAKLGVQLAEEVYGAMNKVVANVMESDRVANEIAMSSREQMLAIDQINDGINQVAMVVNRNSAVAEENASVSNAMNEQITDLSGLVSRFRTKDD